MIINTKFNHGQRVQGIIRGTEQYNETCSFCEGKGKITIKNKEISCPESGCWGNGYIIKTKSLGWYVPKDDEFSWSNFVIQKIACELYNLNNKKVSGNRSWIYYMADSSGTMWNENDLFDSVEKAQEECNKRNKL